MTSYFNTANWTARLTILAGLLAAAWVLHGDLRRRKIRANAYVATAIAMFGGFAFDLLAMNAGWFWPGVVWSGEQACGILAVVILAWRKKITILEFLDAFSPAAAAGYTVVRLVGLISIAWFQIRFGLGVILLGPLSVFIVWAMITTFLWRKGVKAALGPKPVGEIFCLYLMLTGGWRLLYGLLWATPGTYFRLPGIRIASLAAFLIGGILLWWILARYHKVAREHRILQHVAERGEILQPEYSQPTPECPHPERWRMYDSMTAEFEVLDFLKALVVAVKPELVVETGTFLGTSTLRIAEGLRENGFGRIITCENDPKVFEEAKKRFEKSGLADWIELRNESSLEMKIEGTIDLLYCDSDLPLRETEVRWFLPQINPNGLILMHDASSALKTVREGAQKLEREGLLSVVLLPTPRGLVIAQKREGRA
ncbi:MAG: class I SAM-dependent methyltransferase [Candidatus Acidiferrales bacterium]